MPIYLDVQGTQSRDSSHRGIGRYVLELAAAVERSEHASAIAGYVINPDLAVPPALAAVIPAGRLLASTEIDFRPGDVFHLTSPFEDVTLDRVWPPSARVDGVRLVVTVFDLIPLLYPEYYLADPAYHARYKNRIELIRLADRVLAISAATARDVVGILHLPETSVAVSGTGVSARFRPQVAESDPLAAVQARVPAIRPDYILYAGALDFRKNVDSLLVAYSRLPQDSRAKHQLVIVSRLSSPELDLLRPRLRALGLTRDVVVASGVDDDDLVSMYQAARLFVFPSLYEGFGLPVAEAIACGTPTITSNASSLVEIVSDGAALFDPKNPESLRLTMERALNDPGVARRLASAVLDPRHTWPVVAERMIEACVEVERLPVATDDRRTAAIAALAAGEQAPWIEDARAKAHRGPARSFGRRLLWPLRRFFDPRFAGVDTHVTTMHADLSARMDRAFGPWGSQSLADIERSISRLADLVTSQNDAAFISGAGSRALGLAHALASVGQLVPGARVLDASTPPTGLAPVLTALGFEVSIVASISHSELQRPPEFDAVIAVGADEAARDLPRFLRPGGTLIVSIEARNPDEIRGRLSAVLGSLSGTEDLRVLKRLGDDSWESAQLDDPSLGVVVLVTVQRPLIGDDSAVAAATGQARVGVARASEE